MSDCIHIGHVSVPLVDYAVGGAAILGIRDSGKTVTGKGIAEQLLDNGVPIIVFDAVGKWRWMKMAGKTSCGKGYKVVVAGGRDPDLPLTPHSVPEIVRSALKHRIPLIIDLFEKSLSKADWRRIVQTAIRIIHYENEGGAVHVFLEEAAEYVPQRVQDGEVYAEVEKLVRMGGNASVGITLINQRSQEVNKAVLDQCTTLVLGCQVGSKAIEAVGKWVDRLDADTANEVTESLPTLTAGEAWVWTRQNPDKPHREKIPMCRSLHPDRRTPEVVLQSSTPTDTAEFVAKMKNAIPKVIEEAKSNDPAELKKKIAALQRELNAKPVQSKPETVKVPVLSKAQERILERTQDTVINVKEWISKHTAELSKLNTQLDTISKQMSGIEVQRVTEKSGTKVPLFIPPPKHEKFVFPSKSDSSLGRCERAILTVLAEFPNGRSSSQLGVMSVYSQTSGGFNNSLGKLRSLEYITRTNPIQVTDQGLQALGVYASPPRGETLQQLWMSKLGKCERAILQSLISVYPEGLGTEALAAIAGYSVSGGFNNSLGRLRTLELILRGQPIKASETLFE